MSILFIGLLKVEKISGMKIGAEWRFKKNLIDKWIEEESLSKKENKNYE